MGERKLTRSQLIWLSDLRDGEWHSTGALAEGRGIAKRGRGAVGKVFGTMALHEVEWRVVDDMSEFRLTPLGRSALEASNA